MLQAQPALEDAAAALRLLGFFAEDAELIRAAHAVIIEFYRAGVVARVEPLENAPRVRQQVAIADLLDHLGVPAITSAIPSIVETKHHAISLWKRLEILPTPATPDHLGALARQLHAATRGLSLPPSITVLDPIAEIEAQLPQSAPVLGDMTDLQARIPPLREAWERAFDEDPLGVVLLHGDLNRDNVAVTEQGPVLMDLELSARGPASWDLVAQTVAVRRYGASRSEYQRFLTVYGADPMAWEGAEAMCEIYAFMVASWAIQHRRASGAMWQEAQVRLAGIRGQSTEPWTLL